MLSGDGRSIKLIGMCCLFFVFRLLPFWFSLNFALLFVCLLLLFVHVLLVCCCVVGFVGLVFGVVGLNLVRTPGTVEYVPGTS